MRAFIDKKCFMLLHSRAVGPQWMPHGSGGAELCAVTVGAGSPAKNATRCITSGCLTHTRIAAAASKHKSVESSPEPVGVPLVALASQAVDSILGCTINFVMAAMMYDNWVQRSAEIAALESAGVPRS